MTIAIAVQVHDGVVLASDSASTLIDSTLNPPDNIINVYNNANKIFNLVKGLPIGAVTYGAGSIGTSSISTLAKDLRRRLSGKDKDHMDWHLNPDSYTIKEVAERAQKFLFEETFKGLPSPNPAMFLGFLVVGYSAGASLSEGWLVEIKDGESPSAVPVIAQGEAKLQCGGEPEVFSRLVLGHSLKLRDALVKGGVDKANVDNVINGLRAEMHIGLVEHPMPIQDAIDLAEFLVTTTSTFTRFKRGAATVGGPIESAAITKHEGFKWVRRKHYFNSTLNPGGLDDQAH